MSVKYLILVGDGMGDYPLEELQGRTILEAAKIPGIDELLSRGRMGLVRTIPRGMEPGSDVANMNLLGYDPRAYHTGRGPLEAASMGIRLASDEVAFRCNLVSMETDAAGEVRMLDHSAGHIATSEARRLVEALQPALEDGPLKLYPGVSYRHLLVHKGGRSDLETTPPHDIPGEPVAPYRKVYEQEPALATFMEKAQAILARHPVTREHREAGKRTADGVWLWGQGKAPSMPTLRERYGLEGAMISAVDLLKGLGVYAGLEPIDVPGATGYLDTDYAGKVRAALDALEDLDLVYVHIEAPDETGHEGSVPRKLQAVEAFDEKVVKPLVEGVRKHERVRVLVVTDHYTPVSVRTHVTDPVPFLLVSDLRGPQRPGPRPATFCERTAGESGWLLESGSDLFDLFIKGES